MGCVDALSDALLPFGFATRLLLGLAVHFGRFWVLIYVRERHDLHLELFTHGQWAF